LTFQNVDAAEDRWPAHGTADAEVGIAGKPSDCSTHLKFRRGHDVDIEFHAIEWRVGGG